MSRKHQRVVSREYELRKAQRRAERNADETSQTNQTYEPTETPESVSVTPDEGRQDDMIANTSLFVEGLITEGSRGRYRVEAETGALWCVVRGRLRKELIYAESASARRTVRAAHVNQHDPVAIGDRVLARAIGSGEGVIERVVTRAGASLTREDPDPGQRGLTAVRGIEQFVIVFAAREPAPHLRLADRFIALAEAQEATVILCVNKADQGIEPWLRERLAVYAELGYAVVTTSAATGESVDALRELLAGRVSALMGPSGVGKSSLLNALEPGLALRVSEVSASTGKGRHTTTGARMAPLSGPAGGWIADTAGIRALGLGAETLRDLPWLFREFRPWLGSCAFGDCQHLSEPGCAIIAAARSGAIDVARYDSYRRLANATDSGMLDGAAESGDDWDEDSYEGSYEREEPWHAKDG